MYLELWLISRWRLPATPCFSLPVAVSLKRFLTPLLGFSVGILVSLVAPLRCAPIKVHFDGSSPGDDVLKIATAALTGRAIPFSTKCGSAPLSRGGARWQVESKSELTEDSSAMRWIASPNKGAMVRRRILPLGASGSPGWMVSVT